MCGDGRRDHKVASDMQNICCLCWDVCVSGKKIDFSQGFLPSLHIYFGRISLVNIGLNQTLKSLIAFKQTLHYSAVDTSSERKKQGKREGAQPMAVFFSRVRRKKNQN